jgi:hypothetical protein
MQLEVLGSRLLVRRYEAPETSAGGIIVPDNYRTSYDGKLFEVVAVGNGVQDKLCCVGTIGPKLIPGLSGDFESEPFVIEPDDIIQLRGFMRGVWAGPEVRRQYGYDCWFVEVVDVLGDLTSQTRERCAIEWVWPARSWMEAAA